MNTPMETAIHWVEYVAKFKGSLHMQGRGVQLPLYVYYNVDVWAFICCSLGFFIYVLVKLVQKTGTMGFPSNKQKML